MYVYVITQQNDYDPGKVNYFKGLYEKRGECPIAMFGRQGKPKTFRREAAARKAFQRMQNSGAWTNTGCSCMDTNNFRIKEIDLHSNCVMEYYI